MAIQYRNKYTSPWTEEMEDFLLEHYGSRSLAWLSKKLGKSPGAIIGRLSVLQEQDKHLLSGTITAHQLAAALNVSSPTVRNWIVNKGLPANQGSHYVENNAKFKAEPNKHFFISVEKFWKWAEQNRSIITWSRVPFNSLPPEPEWVEAERRKIDEKGPKRWLPWSDADKEALWIYCQYQKKTTAEAAVLLGRTRESVQYRLRQLRKERLKHNEKIIH